MTELLMKQTCPYCQHEVEDYESVWDYEAAEEVECDHCNETYVVKPQYRFEGFLMEKQCKTCGEWSDDGYVLCDCENESEE